MATFEQGDVMANPGNPSQPSTVNPDTPLHEEKQKVGQHTSVDDEPDEPDEKTQHGRLSEAQKGSQPGLTGHSERSGKDKHEGKPLRQPQESGQSALDE
jgi:hypothetical protein